MCVLLHGLPVSLCVHILHMKRAINSFKFFSFIMYATCFPSFKSSWLRDTALSCGWCWFTFCRSYIAFYPYPCTRYSMDSVPNGAFLFFQFYRVFSSLCFLNMCEEKKNNFQLLHENSIKLTNHRLLTQKPMKITIGHPLWTLTRLHSNFRILFFHVNCYFF